MSECGAIPIRKNSIKIPAKPYSLFNREMPLKEVNI